MNEKNILNCYSILLSSLFDCANRQVTLHLGLVDSVYSNPACVKHDVKPNFQYNIVFASVSLLYHVKYPPTTKDQTE